MVRKRIRRILSGGAAIFIVLFCTLNANGQFGGVKVTYTITGSTGVSGATMAGLPGQGGQTVTTDQNGYYSATVDYAWGGAVRPVKEGWTFEPASKSYQRVTASMSAEDYTPTEITYTISGKITGAEGVELSGLPGTVITGPDGSYSVTVPYGWGEMVTPIKEGFTFLPSSKPYLPVKANMTQNYKAETVKFLIIGSVGEAGVTIKGLPGGSVVSKSNGSFSQKVDYGWTGVITPEKEGYEFAPISLSYDSIITDQTGVSFSANVLTFVVTGTTGMAGVQMKGLPGAPYTDENGYFEANVNYGFTGTVTPWIDGYEFEPASLMLAKVNSDRNQNFSASVIKLTISGSTRLPGVEMNGLPDNPITGADGSYSVTVDYGWTGTVTPLKEGYMFAPESKTYQAVRIHTLNQGYAGKKITYTISGNTQISGVTIKGLPGGRPIVTGATGSYSAQVDYDWSGTITPSKEGYDFEPINLQFTGVMAPLSAQDFTPKLLQRKISGIIRASKGGQPVADVAVITDNDGGQAMTDASGRFELVVDYGWNGKVIPQKEGYTFQPPNKQHSRITADQLNQTFAATRKMFDVTGEVKLGGIPIDGVLITASDGTGSPITATTDLRGKYSLKLPYGWTGEIAPTKDGILFDPPSAPLINVVTPIVNGLAVLPKAPPVSHIPRTPSTPLTTVAPPAGIGPGTSSTTVIPSEAPPAGVGPGTSPPTLTAAERELMDLKKRLEDLETGNRRIPTAGGPAADPSTILISNSWLDNDLALEVLPAIAEQAGVAIIPDETVGGIVSLDLDRMPLERALDMVLASTPFVWKKTRDYYIVASAGISDPKFALIAETRRVRLNYITAEAALGLLHTAFKPYVQAEIALPETRGTATAGARIPKTYTILVTAPPAMMERIVADLKLVDQVPGQVLLKARIVAMSRTDLLNLGVEWGWPTFQAGLFSNNNQGFGDAANDFGGTIPWGVQMGYTPDLAFTNSLQLALNLLTVNGEATILSKPQVLAQDGKLATMKVVNEEYFFLTADTGSNQFFQSSQLETIESGTTLSITPHIGEANDIMLDISIEVSDSIAQGRVSDLPVVTRRIAENTVRILDGGTVWLSGLTQERSVTTHKRTPGLSNLPLIGGLFNNSNDSAVSREIAVFVTAYILRHDSQQAMNVPRAAQQGFASPTNQGFSTPAELGYNSPSRDRDFGRTPVNQGFNRAPVDQGFNRTPTRPASTRPMGTGFQDELRDAMSRGRTR